MNEILETITKLLSKSKTHQVWIDPHNALIDGCDPKVHIIRKIDAWHYIIDIINDEIYVDYDAATLRAMRLSNHHVFCLPLNAPNSITILEEFFDVESMDAKTQDFDHIAAITALIP